MEATVSQYRESTVDKLEIAFHGEPRRPQVAPQGEQAPADVPQIPAVQADRPESSLRRTKRVARVPERLGTWIPSEQVDEHLVQDPDDAGMLLIAEEEPSTFHESHSSLQKAKWMVVMQREMRSLDDNKT